MSPGKSFPKKVPQKNGSCRKICVITGTRAEFGILRPVLDGILASPVLDLQLVVTGTHILPEYGETISEIRRLGYPVSAEVPLVVAGDDKRSMALSIGVGVITLTQALELLGPDIVFILGDRYEMLAAAIAASYSGRIVAHYGGGDTAGGGYDEYTRHAITKVSHIHFVLTERSARCVRHLGEDPSRVFVVGSAALDTILKGKRTPASLLRKKYGMKPGAPLALVIQHPNSVEPDQGHREIGLTLEALVDLKIPSVVIHPNADPGRRQMVQEIERYEEAYPGIIRGFRSLPFEDYLGFMQMASVLVGNSSSGIVEAPSFHLPVVNIGDRQISRERAANVIDVPPEFDAIRNAIGRAVSDPGFRKKASSCTNPYGRGDAGHRIIDVLERLSPDEIQREKRMFSRHQE